MVSNEETETLNTSQLTIYNNKLTIQGLSTILQAAFSVPVLLM